MQKKKAKGSNKELWLKNLRYQKKAVPLHRKSSFYPGLTWI
jgi:hypothetical protein